MTDSQVLFPAAGHTEQRLLAFDSPTLAGYTWPYFTISGAQDGPTVCLLAGVHGAEYPPIDALMRFCRDLDPLTLRGRVIGVPVVNLPAFWERTPFVCPRDGKNPNRMFPGKAIGTFSEVLAHHITESVIRQGDYLIDIHCGDMVEDLLPFTIIQESGRPEVDSVAMDMAITYGLECVVALPPDTGPYVVANGSGSRPVAGTTDEAAAQLGIPAITPEAGSIGQLQSEAVQAHLRGLQRVFQRLEMLDGTPAPQSPPMLVREFKWVRAERGGFFRKAISAGDRLEAGGLIGQMVDLWGAPQAEITSPVAGVVLFVTTSPAILDSGLIVGIGVPA
ncbi:MAG: putative succinylglutamate desuccinylase / aspartoacylase family [Chloroflexi bacterium]|nr:putative succinylglutamate desuccinylase / aspartoacylase family [Chloroflexota bacterium]